MSCQGRLGAVHAPDSGLTPRPLWTTHFGQETLVGTCAMTCIFRRRGGKNRFRFRLFCRAGVPARCVSSPSSITLPTAKILNTAARPPLANPPHDTACSSLSRIYAWVREVVCSALCSYMYVVAASPPLLFPSGCPRTLSPFLTSILTPSALQPSSLPLHPPSAIAAANVSEHPLMIKPLPLPAAHRPARQR